MRNFLYVHIHFLLRVTWTYNKLRNRKDTEFLWEEPKFKEIIANAKVVYDARMDKYGHLFDE